jgi:hypothetical protein
MDDEKIVTKGNMFPKTKIEDYVELNTEARENIYY